MVASKRDAISAILGLNPTADPAFLAEFSKDDLEQYLSRLGRIIELDEGPSRFLGDDFDRPGHPHSADAAW
jgi:hypothetical protein